MKSNFCLSLIALFLMIFGCSSEENKDIIVLDANAQNISGTWKLTETYISPGGETEWKPAANPYTYSFNDDGKFSASDIQPCKEGEYILSNNMLSLSCDDKALQWRINTLSSGILVLSHIGCVEACLYKFIRID